MKQADKELLIQELMKNAPYPDDPKFEAIFHEICAHDIDAIEPILDEILGKPLGCGCITAKINPHCPRGHVAGAFALRLKVRPTFSVDLEDRQ
jgi:hypothetical protein